MIRYLNAAAVAAIPYDHATLSNLTTGDPHTQYPMLSGGDTYTGTHTMGGTLNITGTLQKGGTTAKQLVFSGSFLSTNANTTTTNTAVAMTGATTTQTLVSGDLVVINAGFDVTSPSTNAGSPFLGTFCVNTTAQSSQVIFNPATVGGGTNGIMRYTLSGAWQYTVPSNGSYTLDIRVACAGTATSYIVQNTHTYMNVLVFR